jgi:hypothetical protein
MISALDRGVSRFIDGMSTRGGNLVSVCLFAMFIGLEVMYHFTRKDPLDWRFIIAWSGAMVVFAGRFATWPRIHRRVEVILGLAGMSSILAANILMSPRDLFSFRLWNVVCPILMLVAVYQIFRLRTTSGVMSALPQDQGPQSNP